MRRNGMQGIWGGQTHSFRRRVSSRKRMTLGRTGKLRVHFMNIRTWSSCPGRLQAWSPVESGHEGLPVKRSLGVLLCGRHVFGQNRTAEISHTHILVVKPVVNMKAVDDLYKKHVDMLARS